MNKTTLALSLAQAEPSYLVEAMKPMKPSLVEVNEGITGGTHAPFTCIT